MTTQVSCFSPFLLFVFTGVSVAANDNSSIQNDIYSQIIQAHKLLEVDRAFSHELMVEFGFPATSTTCGVSEFMAIQPVPKLQVEGQPELQVAGPVMAIQRMGELFITHSNNHDSR